MSQYPRNRVPSPVRAEIVKLFNEGNRMCFISEFLQVNYETVRTVLRRYQDVGRQLKPKGVQKRTLTSEQVDQLKLWIAEDCRRTSADLAKMLSDTFNIRIRKMTIDKYLTKQNFRLLNPYNVDQLDTDMDVPGTKYNELDFEPKWVIIDEPTLGPPRPFVDPSINRNQLSMQFDHIKYPNPDSVQFRRYICIWPQRVGTEKRRIQFQKDFNDKFGRFYELFVPGIKRFSILGPIEHQTDIIVPTCQSIEFNVFRGFKSFSPTIRFQFGYCGQPTIGEIESDFLSRNFYLGMTPKLKIGIPSHIKDRMIWEVEISLQHGSRDCFDSGFVKIFDQTVPFQDVFTNLQKEKCSKCHSLTHPSNHCRKSGRIPCFYCGEPQHERGVGCRFTKCIYCGVGHHMGSDLNCPKNRELIRMVMADINYYYRVIFLSPRLFQPSQQ